jgi:hypothetical protein
MTDIIAINQGLLDKSALAINKDVHDIDMLIKFSTTGYFSTSAQLGLMPRYGVNNLPFKNHAIDFLQVGIPDWQGFSKTWDEITDARCCEIQQKILDTNKKIVIQWSGGIDSTCILVSILKNFNKADRNRVTVACNWGSIVENPGFYYDHIVPNFSIVDINQFTIEYRENFSRYLVVNGMPGDVILQSVAGLDLGMHLEDPMMLKESWRLQPDKLISYLCQTFQCNHLGRWYYEKISENILSVDIPVETYFDFLWWGGFNYHWLSQVLFEWHANCADGKISWQDHRDSFVNWYETDDYQKWSMINNKEKYGKSVGDFKKSPKKYIYDYNRDEWYYKYKIKMGSAGRNQQNARSMRAFAILDNFEILYLDRDLEKIRKLFPDYLKTHKV